MKVASIVQFIKDRGQKDEAPNARGNTIHRLFMHDERYLVDFADDFKPEGWEQFDTDQDASYFGVWVNRRLMLTLAYAEGDWSLVVCGSVESYNAEIQSCIDFYGDGLIARVIDADGITEIRQDRSLFLVS